MGASSGLAGLKCIQWIFRGIQFCCSVLVLGIYSYYLATMMSAKMDVPTGVKAVVGISAGGTLYTLLSLLLVCCCSGHIFPSFVASVIDVAFAAAYIYVAVQNRAGASSCTSGKVDTVYGSGDAAARPSGTGGGTNPVTRLPTFQLACQMQTACLIAACITILFFLLSIFMGIKMNRSRYRNNRPMRDAEGEYISKSDHYGAPPDRRSGRKGFLGALRRRGTGDGDPADPDALLRHQQPGDVQPRHVEAPPAWGEVSSLHDSDRLYFNDGVSRDSRLGHDGPPVTLKPTTAPQPAADSYAEGDVPQRQYDTYDLYREDEHGNDHSETGHTKKQRESKAARVDRLTAA